MQTFRVQGQWVPESAVAAASDAAVAAGVEDFQKEHLVPRHLRVVDPAMRRLVQRRSGLTASHAQSLRNMHICE